MFLQAFIDKYSGKFIDFDGYYGNQCVDLVQQYNKEVFNGSFLSGANAYDIYSTYPKDIYGAVDNSPTGIPGAGNIVVWSKSFNGTAGHIGIATGTGNTDTFECFVQNDPTGSNCHLKTYNYNSVLGWLVPKVTTQNDDLATCLAQHTVLVDQCNKKDSQITALNLTIQNLNSTIAEKNNQIVKLQATSSTQEVQVTELTSQLATAQEQAKKVPNLQTQIDLLTASRKGYMDQVSALQTQLTKIKTQLVPKKYLSLKIYKALMSLE